MFTLKKFPITLFVKKAEEYIVNGQNEDFCRLIEIGATFVPINSYVFKVLKFLYGIYSGKLSHFKGYMQNLFNKLDSNQREKFITNFIVNNLFYGFSKQKKLLKKNKFYIPGTIPIEPENCCDLYGAKSKKKKHLSFEKMDKIVASGKKRHCYSYFFTRIQPLIRKKDILKLCAKHHDCFFSGIIDASLIDEVFVCCIKKAGNFIPIIDIGEIEQQRDTSQYAESFSMMTQAMEILNKNNLAFGFSCRCNISNYKTVTKDEFIDFLIQKGAWFGFYYTTAPDSNVDTAIRPYVHQRVSQIRSQKPILVFEFWEK